MRNAIYSLILSSVFAPALMLIVPPSDVPAKNQSDWPVIPVEVETPEVADVPEVAKTMEAPAAAFESNPSIDEQAKSLESLADEIRTIAGKVQKDADRAKDAADEAKRNADLAGKNFEGMKSYVPPVSDIEPLTEARVIELIDQRIKELKIECKCVTTGQTVKKSVPVTMDNRGVAAFDLGPNETIVGYEDVVTGKWVTVNQASMQSQVIANQTERNSTLNSYKADGSEYREIQYVPNAPKRAAIRFSVPAGWMQPGPVSGFSSSGTCRMRTVNGVQRMVCGQQP